MSYLVITIRRKHLFLYTRTNEKLLASCSFVTLIKNRKIKGSEDRKLMSTRFRLIPVTLRTLISYNAMLFSRQYIERADTG